MSDKEKDEEIAHEILIPDNTYGVFCTLDKKRNELQIYDGNFNGSDMIENIGIRIREVLESVVEEASIRLAEGQADNMDYNTGAAYDRDNTVLSVSLAF